MGVYTTSEAVPVSIPNTKFCISLLIAGSTLLAFVVSRGQYMKCTISVLPRKNSRTGVDAELVLLQYIDPCCQQHVSSQGRSVSAGKDNPVDKEIILGNYQVSATDICILLIEPDSRCLRKMLSSLLDAGYRAVTVSRGDEALATLRRKKRTVDLVLTRTKLPDMCAFELVEILETQFRMAVVMICDSYDGATILRGLTSGAMFCLSMPLHQHAIDRLWQHAAVKSRELELELEAEMEAMLESLESSVTEEDSRNKKRKINDLEKAEGSSMGLLSAITWTHDLHCKFLEVVCGLGIDVAAPSEVLRCMNVPGLTIEIVIEKLQEYHLYLQRHQELNFDRKVPFFPELAPNNQPPNVVNQLMPQENYISSFAYEDALLMTGFLQNPQETVFGYQADPTSGVEQMQAMALLDAIPPPFPVVLPNTLQQHQAPPVPSANAELPVIIALPAPGLGAYEAEKDGQIRGG